MTNDYEPADTFESMSMVRKVNGKCGVPQHALRRQKKRDHLIKHGSCPVIRNGKVVALKNKFTLIEAKIAVKAYKKFRKIDNLNIYRCSSCRCYHVGRKS